MRWRVYLVMTDMIPERLQRVTTVFALACLLLAEPPLAASGSDRLTDGEIMDQAWCPDCMQWRWSGVCFWMTCTVLGCDVDESERYSHFIPEVVVSSYSGETPWPGGTLGLTGVNGTQSQGEEAPNDPDHLRFKNVDIIGSPALFVFDALARSDVYCKSSATAYFPYYVSSLDVLGWRAGLPEAFYPSTYFSTHIDSGDGGSGLARYTDPGYSDWGSLYPRQGFLIQGDDPKAAAVMAQRAVDFTSRSGQPHVYVPLPTQCEQQKCWPPGEAVLKDASTHTWQMLYPKPQQTCGLFGESAQWSEGLYNGEEAYAWHLWRPWSCCKPAGAIYLGAVTVD